MNTRNESIDCLKGVAILLVMFGHVQVHNQMTDPYLYDVIKSLQMPLFMLISGYLAGAGTKIDSLASYRQRLGKRAIAYLVPFFSWLCLQHYEDIPKAIHRVLFQLDYGLWFLMALFLFTWMAYSAQLAAHFRAKRSQKDGEWVFWLVFLGSCALVLAAYLLGVTFLSPSILIIYLPYYTAAYFVGLHPDFAEKICPVRVQRMLAIVCGIIFLAMAAALDLVTVTGPLMLLVQTGASFLGCFAVLRLVLDLKPCALKSKLAALGRYTLEIYVLHYHFATVLNPDGRVYTFWSPEGLLYAAAAFVAMSLITAALVYIINRVKPLPVLLFGKI